MKTLICAGGSGTRVLEAVLHLCAAGLGPDELSVMMIDPDGGNGNGDRTKILINKYLECQEAFGGKMGNLGFFHTQLDLPGSRGVLKAWSPVGVNQEFREVLNLKTLDRKSQDVAHLFFTDQELEMKTNVGFRGHPTIGAATMALLSLYRHEAPWSELSEKIRQDLMDSNGVGVAIVGSVFGGTGASSIYPVARFLRSVPSANHDRLKIAAVALVPYFQFRSIGGAPAPGAAAKSEWFALATKSAAEFYHDLRDNEEDSWTFDYQYWLGDDSLMEVDYHIGGPKQENPAHFVDLLAAVACLDFLDGGAGPKGCRYAGPQECDEARYEDKNVLRWEDIPLSGMGRDTLQAGLLQFMLVGAMHLGFFEPLLDEPCFVRKPYLVPWYLDRFSSRGDNLTAPENKKQIALITGFFRDLSFPWWSQIHATEQERVRLFNRNAFVNGKNGGVSVELFRLVNLLWPDRVSDHTLNGVDRFFSDMVEVSPATSAQRGVATYLALLGNAAGRFIEREYRQKNGMVV